MRNTMKTLAALASLAIIPTASAGNGVYAPHPGKVTATTYNVDGSFHGAVDVAPTNTPCRYWNVSLAFVGTWYWNVTINNTTTSCTVATGNVAVHKFSDGRAFRIVDFIKSPASFDKTCDRCQIGDAGLHTHVQYNKNGTKDTSWYSSHTVKGEVIDAGELLGVID